uniref:Uncharacterized protein n=2 Tax=Brassica oleracea TaxID=3712 RepID=A0A0D3D1X1_BRAOL|nr:unnamed protein product [Brassica oleracea]
MFHGSIRPSLLDKEPSGVLIRSHLYPFITDFLKWYCSGAFSMN